MLLHRVFCFAFADEFLIAWRNNSKEPSILKKWRVIVQIESWEDHLNLLLPPSSPQLLNYFHIIVSSIVNNKHHISGQDAVSFIRLDEFHRSILSSQMSLLYHDIEEFVYLPLEIRLGNFFLMKLLLPS